MSNTLQQVLIDALPSPILAFDASDAIVYANAAAEDFFQSSAASLRKLKSTDVFPYASPALQVVAQVRERGTAVNEYGIAVGTPRFGGERVMDLQSSAVAEEPGMVLVTILRRSMAESLNLQFSHQGAARSVSGMAAMLAHEIKNPLAGIKGAAQLLEPGLADQDRPLATLICEETDRIRNLVDRMEIFSDERAIERKPVNIHLVLDRVKTLLAAQEESRITFQEDYDPSLPPVSGNHDQLVQVFLNLAKNAVEAMPQGGKIVLSTAFRPGIKLAVTPGAERVSLPLEIGIHDEGSGVPDDLRPHIFDPFVTTKSQGKGLGLALVAKIIRDHGGMVDCRPRDKGTTFRVLLPYDKTGA